MTGHAGRATLRLRYGTFFPAIGFQRTPGFTRRPRTMDQPEETAPGTDVREALYDLQRYLSDAIPPLMVSESMELLTRRAPELTASQIHSWVGAQNRGAGVAVPVSDYFFHAIKKIHLLGEYDLIPRESLRRFVYEISRIVLPYCPAEDRELLRTNLQRLGETDAVSPRPPNFSTGRSGAPRRRWPPECPNWSRRKPKRVGRR